MALNVQEYEVNIALKNIDIMGELSIPKYSKALIIFSHGSGSSRKSSRNRYVAKGLNQAGFATLLFNLLTREEEMDRQNVFNIPFLSERLLLVTKWAQKESKLKRMPIGYFGASTGAAAALVAAADRKDIFALVSRGGRPDLALEQLHKVECPVLLIVGSQDFEVIELNKSAKASLKHSELSIIPSATHLFEEPGTLDEVIDLATNWFAKKFPIIKEKGNFSEVWLTGF